MSNSLRSEFSLYLRWWRPATKSVTSVAEALASARPAGSKRTEEFSWRTFGLWQTELTAGSQAELSMYKRTKPFTVRIGRRGISLGYGSPNSACSPSDPISATERSYPCRHHHLPTSPSKAGNLSATFNTNSNLIRALSIEKYATPP